MRNVINENRKVTKSLSAAADLLIDITLLISAIFLLSFVNLNSTLIIITVFILFTILYFSLLKNSY